MKYKCKPFHIVLLIFGALGIFVDFMAAIGILIIAAILIIVDSRKQKKKYYAMLEEQKRREEEAKRMEEQRREYERRHFNEDAMKSKIEDFKSWCNELAAEGVDIQCLVDPRAEWICEPRTPRMFTRTGNKIVIGLGYDHFSTGSILQDLNNIAKGKWSIKNVAAVTQEYFVSRTYRKIQVVDINDILYWHVAGEIEEKTVATGVGPSAVGLAVTEAVWGTAAAVNKAIQGNAQNSRTITTDNRYIEILFTYESGMQPFTVEYKDEIKIKRMLPEKMK